jgi:hypothetical protein
VETTRVGAVKTFLSYFLSVGNDYEFMLAALKGVCANLDEKKRAEA